MKINRLLPGDWVQDNKGNTTFVTGCWLDGYVELAGQSGLRYYASSLHIAPKKVVGQMRCMLRQTMEQKFFERFAEEVERRTKKPVDEKRARKFAMRCMLAGCVPVQAATRWMEKPRGV